MKGKIKGLLLIMCMVITMITVTACSEAKEEENVSAASESSLTEEEGTYYKETAAQLIQQIVAFTDTEIEQYMAVNDPFTTAVLTSWSDAKEELGAFKSIISQDTKTVDNMVVVSSQVEFEIADATVEMQWDLSQNAPVDMSFTLNYDKSVLLKKAAMDTVIGLGIVFAILCFLAFLISLFRNIPNSDENLIGTETASEMEASEQNAEELQNNDELVAVIAAAIAASENTPVDGFVVRSIKRSNRILRRA